MPNITTEIKLTQSSKYETLYQGMYNTQYAYQVFQSWGESLSVSF